MNQRGANHVGSTRIQWRASKTKIVAVSYFRNGHTRAEFFFEFDPTSTGNNSPLKSATPKKYNLFSIKKDFNKMLRGLTRRPHHLHIAWRRLRVAQWTPADIAYPDCWSLV